MLNVFDLQAVLTLITTDYDKGISDAQTKFEKFGSTLSTIGGTLTKTVTLPLVAIGTAAATVAANFETAFAKLQTIADTTEVSVGDLQSGIKSLSDQTGISMSDVAEAAYNAISAGQDTADVLSFVEYSAKLAMGGFTDLSTATDVLTTALNAYGLSADQVSHVSDVLIETQNEGKTTVDELASSMGRVIPTASAAGVGIEDLASQYVALTKNGIGTAEATTYINGMLNELSKSGSTAFEAFEEATGQTFPDYIAAGHSTAEAMAELSSYMESTGLKVSDAFGSSEAAKAANVLVQHAEDSTTALENMKNMSGQTEDAFGTMSETTANKLKKLKTSLQNLGIVIGESILPVVTPIIEKITEGLRKVSEWWDTLSPQTQDMIVKVAMIAAAIGPVLVIVGKAILIIGKLRTVFYYLRMAMAVMGGPITLIIAAIAALVAGFIYLWNTSEGFRNFWIGLWENLKEIVSAVVTAIVTAFSDTWEDIKAIWGAVSGFFSGVWEGVKGIFAGVKEWFSEKFSAAWSAIVSEFSAIGQWFSDRWDDITEVFHEVADWFSEKFEDARDSVHEAFKDIGSWFSDRYNDIKTVFANVKSWFSEKFNGAKDKVHAAFQGIGSWFKERYADIKAVYIGVEGWFSEKFLAAYGAVQSAFNGIGSWFKERWNDIVNALSAVDTWFTDHFGDAYTSIKDAFFGIGEFFAGVWEDITGAFPNLYDFFSELFGDAVQAIKDRLGPLGDWIAGLFGGSGIDVSVNVPDVSKIKAYAMDSGGIVTQPTLAVVGERRPEFVGALDDLRTMIREEANGTTTINVYGAQGQDVSALADKVAERIKQATDRRRRSFA
ncbi:MAG: phage tail tape measure protein [Lachnospiraceae bacterium]|nr:phage tail tape measure protein [Lachnospiraceae bacterium]